MSLSTTRTLTTTWLVLMTVTVVSVVTAEYPGQRTLAVAAIMAISSVKVGLILHRFMDLGAAPSGIRAYMAVWTVGSAGLIFAMFLMSPT